MEPDKEIWWKMSAEIHSYLIAVFISSLVSGAIYWLARQRSKIGLDIDLGPQKIHQGAVPRIGGMAIFIGVFLSIPLLQSVSMPLFGLLAIAATPVFLAGIVEDFTGSVSAQLRLIVSLISGCLFCWITGYQVTSVGIDALGFLFAMPLISFLMTSLAIGAMVNALNIVDGLNGLASTSAVLMIASFGVLSKQFGDFELQVICFSIVAASSGFLIWNFPFGKVFLGDGGAYFLGALAAGVAVLLPERNDGISPFSSMLIIIYPFYELVRSTARRILVKGYKAFEPDNQHLHSQIHRFVSSRVSMDRVTQNSLSSVVVLILPLFCCCWAVVFMDDRVLLTSGIFVFILMYEMAMAMVLLLNNKNA